MKKISSLIKLSSILFIKLLSTPSISKFFNQKIIFIINLPDKTT